MVPATHSITGGRRRRYCDAICKKRAEKSRRWKAARVSWATRVLSMSPEMATALVRINGDAWLERKRGEARLLLEGEQSLNR